MKKEEVFQHILSKSDKKKFQTIYVEYYSDLLRYGLKIHNNKDVVKDCIHEMMVQFFIRKTSFESVEKIKPFLLVSLRNKILDSIIYQNKLVFDVDVIEPTEQNTIEWIIGEQAREQDIRKVHRVIAALPPKQREVIHLRFYENISLPEIAKIMQINYQSVQNLLQRSLKSLSENLVIQEIKKGGTLFFQFIYLGKVRTYFFKIST